jgi:hypothetical protein
MNPPTGFDAAISFSGNLCDKSGKNYGRPVVRFNPACGNRSLPVTAIQFMSIEYRPATPQKLEEFKPRNDRLADYVGLFSIACLSKKWVN